MQIAPSIRYALLVLYALALLVLSLMPVPLEVISDIISWDKAQHALAYAVLTALGGWALTPRLGARRAWRRAALLGIGYGALLEVGQALGGHRMAQFADGVANALGAAVAYLVWRCLCSFGEGGACR